MSKRHRITARPQPRLQRRRRGTITLIGAGALALAAAAWMTMSASPAMSANPVASSPQAQRAPAPAPSPDQTIAPAAAPAPAKTAAASTAPADPAPAPVGPAPAGSAAQQAHIDPKTGQLRPAEHDDAPTLRAAARSRLARTAQAASEPVEFFTDSGVPGATVPDEVQAYTVATKTPDGKVVIEHVQGGKAAAERVRQHASKTGLTQKKEEPNDR
jgi:hypothetical protein